MRGLACIAASSLLLLATGCVGGEDKAAEIKGEVKTANVDPNEPIRGPQPPQSQEDELNKIYGGK
jgi:hypothetical protein